MDQFNSIVQAVFDRADLPGKGGAQLPMLRLLLTIETRDATGSHTAEMPLWMEPANALRLSMGIASVLRSHFPELFIPGAPSD